jgi:amidophosphoribosyltransferase
VNPAVTSFETSCFSGEYITGDITQQYLDDIEAQRRIKTDEEMSSVTQLDLGLELAEQG